EFFSLRRMWVVRPTWLAFEFNVDVGEDNFTVRRILIARIRLVFYHKIGIGENLAVFADNVACDAPSSFFAFDVQIVRIIGTHILDVRKNVISLSTNVIANLDYRCHTGVTVPESDWYQSSSSH